MRMCWEVQDDIPYATCPEVPTLEKIKNSPPVSPPSSSEGLIASELASISKCTLIGLYWQAVAGFDLLLYQWTETAHFLEFAGANLEFAGAKWQHQFAWNMAARWNSSVHRPRSR